MRFQRIVLTVISLAVAASLGGQTTKLNNTLVQKMKAAGLDDETVVKAIEATPGEYDTSADGLIALKTGGVSETIIGAILSSAKESGATATRLRGPVEGYPDELGIYYFSHNAYMALEPETMSIRTTNALATMYSYGIKPQKINGWIVGNHSKNKVAAETLTFCLVIPEGVSPTEYTLLSFREKSHRREVELGRARFSLKMGTEHSSVRFESQKIDKGRYKITATGLKPGEYGFMPPGAEVSRNSSSAGKIYSFQVE